MSSRPLFRRMTPGMPGPEFGPAGEPGVDATAQRNSAPPLPSFGGSNSPIPARILRATTLEEFQTLVRTNQVDRIFLDLLDLSPGPPSRDSDIYCVVLSAHRGASSILAQLTVPADPGGHDDRLGEAQTFLNVLRSRFLFLGYATSSGLASASLAGELPSSKSHEGD